MECNNEYDQKACKLDSCLFFFNAKLARVFGKIADEAFQKTGLSPSHALLLYTVNIRGGIQQREIGETLYLTPSTITRLIEKLERKKLILKKTEGKNVYLCTTQEGLALQDQITESWNHLHERYNGILTEQEAARFIEISSKLLERLGSKED